MAASSRSVVGNQRRPFDASPDVTRLLDAWRAGDAHALDRLTPLVLDDLRRLARSYLRRQAPCHTLQPTALVNEAFVRLLGHDGAGWRGRHHFFAYLATTMRRLLINHAREARAEKRGGDATHVALDVLNERRAASAGAATEAANRVDLLALDRALRSLAEVDPRAARVVELRYFGGLTVEETAEVLEVSPRTVKREWHSARLWLLRALEPEP